MWLDLGVSGANLSLIQFLLNTVVALVLGLFLAWTYTIKNKYTKSFVVTLAMLPAVVSVVIGVVNGNIGTGVAVAGAFSLVRFRSVPGTAKEIGAIFLAMATGLTAGMGYLGHAILFSILLGGLTALYNLSRWGENDPNVRQLHIAIPETLNYSQVFEDIFLRYAKETELLSVKTAHLGSVFKLQYLIKLKADDEEKAFIDALRCRNGNLEISLCKIGMQQVEL